MLIIIGISVIFGMTVSRVFSEEQQPNRQLKPVGLSPQRIVDEFFSDSEYFNTFQGKLPLSRLRNTFKNEQYMDELTTRFNKDCLNLNKPGHTTKPHNVFSCPNAVMALGIGGSVKAQGLIFRFLKENKGMDPFARKAGLFALGYLWNGQGQKLRINLPPADSGTTSPSTADVPEEIIHCLPQSLRGELNPSVSGTGSPSTLCDSPWDVTARSDRDEIRWGLIGCALTGSEKCKRVFENLHMTASEGTSRQAFMTELLKLHAKASRKNGLLCMNEPENRVCQ